MVKYNSCGGPLGGGGTCYPYGTVHSDFNGAVYQMQYRFFQIYLDGEGEMGIGNKKEFHKMLNVNLVIL